MGTARVDACLNATVKDNEEERANIYALARTLERELNEAMLEVEAVRELAGYNDLKSQLAALTAERDEAFKREEDCLKAWSTDLVDHEKKSAALQQQVEALTKERDEACRVLHDLQLGPPDGKPISAELKASIEQMNDEAAERASQLGNLEKK